MTDSGSPDSLDVYKLATIASPAGERYWESDENHVITQISDYEGAEDNLPKVNVIGQTRWGFVGADLEEPKWADHLKALEDRQPFNDFRYSVADDDGSQIYMSVSGTPQFGENGAFAGYLGFARIITDQVLREQEAAENQERLQQAQDIASIGYFERRFDQDAMYWSDQMYKIFDRDKDSFVPTYSDLLEIFEPEDRQDHLDILPGALADGETQKIERHIKIPNGEVREIITLRRVISDEQGKPAKVIGACIDVSEQKKLENEL